MVDGRGKMSDLIVYLKCERNVETNSEDVYIRDLGSLRCRDKLVSEKLRSIRVHHFEKGGPRRCVISVLKIIELMEKVNPDIRVEVVGEYDVLIERVDVSERKGIKQGLKIIMVSLVSFFGTAFTIMAYHVDVGINSVFTEVYRIVMNEEPEGMNLLALSYSIGVAVGIITFFNHVGGRRITKDPTPIEVAMRKYEQDVDVTLIETADRENLEEDTRN